MNKIFAFLMVSFCMVSCSKLLDTKPDDFVAPEYYFNDSTQMDIALTGVYDALQQGNLYSGDGLLTIFNVSDEMYYAQSGTGPKIYNYNAGDATVYKMWSACYVGIQRANLLLANINKPKMNEASRRNIEGQARFLRAYFYFILVQNWGAVPLIITPTVSADDVNASRTPADKVYDFIIEEMEEAEKLVYPISNYNYSGRITKSAVQGILARVCLFKAGFPNNDVSKYADALKWSKKVIESGLHELNKSYNQVFINLVQDKYDTKESIWEVEYYTTGVGDSYKEYGPSLSVTLGVTQRLTNYGYVGGSYRVHRNLYNLYEKDPYLKDSLHADPSLDLRRDWNIADFYYTGNHAPDKTYYTAEQIYDRQPNKFDRIYELTEKKFQSNTPTNFCVLRYADVLLMAAEADNELNGPTDFAINAVNQVRRRGYGKLLNGEDVKLISITNRGSGYTDTPQVIISGGGGSGATARAILTNGSVTGIEITDHGVHYTSAPVVDINGGGGSGATANAALSKITDADLKPEEIASKEAFRQAIRDERARELCFEGWRRLDLIRWGILVPTLQAMTDDANLYAPSKYKTYAAIAGNNVSEMHNYLPIPIVEMSLNKLLTQNPGW